MPLLNRLAGVEQLIEPSVDCSTVVSAHETSFKQYLVDTLLQGIISKSEKRWLVSVIAFRDLLSKDQLNLIEHILDDIETGMMALVD